MKQIYKHILGTISVLSDYVIVPKCVDLTFQKPMYIIEIKTESYYRRSLSKVHNKKNAKVAKKHKLAFKKKNKHLSFILVSW